MASAPQSAAPSGGGDSPPTRPWLRAYPDGLDWHARYQPGLIGDMLDEAVAAHGARTCIHFLGRRFSYNEIGDLANRAAKGLQELGVREGVKVGLLLPNTPTFVIFYYAILKAGGTVVNFNPLYSVEEIAFQARTAAPGSW